MILRILILFKKSKSVDFTFAKWNLLFQLTMSIYGVPLSLSG